MNKISSEERARDFLERFGFRKKLEDILNEEDDTLVPILTVNLAIFAVAFAVLFGANNHNLTASVLLILISGIIALLGALLNIWYLIRLKTRTTFLKKEQEEVFAKAEKNLTKTFDLFKKIISAGFSQRTQDILKRGGKHEDVMKELESDTNYEFLADEGMFIPLTIMDLSLKETSINLDRCLNSPLQEKLPRLKLFIDRLSDKSKTWALVLSAAFMLMALLIKFLVG
jgi:hypothetical protein